MFGNKGLIATAEAALRQFEKENAHINKSELAGGSRWQNLANEVANRKQELEHLKAHLGSLAGRLKAAALDQISKSEGSIKRYQIQMNTEKKNFTSQYREYDNQIQKLNKEVDLSRNEDQRIENELELRLVQAERDALVLQHYPNLKKMIADLEALIREEERLIRVVKNDYNDALRDTIFQINALTGGEMEVEGLL